MNADEYAKAVAGARKGGHIKAGSYKLDGERRWQSGRTRGGQSGGRMSQARAMHQRARLEGCEILRKPRDV